MAGTVCSVCGNTAGRFTMRGENWFCVPSCIKTSGYRDTAKSTFPFSTNNLGDPNNGPVTVQSLRHLRQLENTHGAHCEVYSNNESYQGGKY